MNYLVIDLEMCRVKKLYRKTYKYASEIIQIGAVLLDEGFNRIATMCEYVNLKKAIPLLKKNRNNASTPQHILPVILSAS